MSAIRKGYVDLPEGQIHYRESGQGFPLILLHQNPSSSAMWEPVLPGFGQAGIRAIALDMPGFGESWGPTTEPGAGGYARSVLSAADGLGLGRFDLLGHHTGATVAMTVAAEWPDRVRRLVLWGIPLLPPERLERLAAEEPPAYEDGGAELVRWWALRARLGGPTVTTAILLRSMIEMLQTGERRPWGHHAVGRTDHAALISRIVQPALALTGDRSSLREATEAAAALLARGQFACFPEAGVDVADECPDQFVTRVSQFLREEGTRPLPLTE